MDEVQPPPPPEKPPRKKREPRPLGTPPRRGRGRPFQRGEDPRRNKAGRPPAPPPPPGLKEECLRRLYALAPEAIDTLEKDIRSTDPRLYRPARDYVLDQTFSRLQDAGQGGPGGPGASRRFDLSRLPPEKRELFRLLYQEALVPEDGVAPPGGPGAAGS